MTIHFVFKREMDFFARFKKSADSIYGIHMVLRILFILSKFCRTQMSPAMWNNRCPAFAGRTCFVGEML